MVTQKVVIAIPDLNREIPPDNQLILGEFFVAALLAMTGFRLFAKPS